MHPHQELAQHFLQRIHYYYPLGLPHFTDSYPGFQNMKRILREKLAAAERGEPKDWRNLVEAARAEWSGFQLFDGVGCQFPCLELSVALTDATLTGLRVHSSLTLSLSLLVDYYAIVVTDNYAYQGPEHSGAWHQFVCSGAQHHLKLEDKIDLLQSVVSLHFPHYQRAPHRVLFSYKIHGGYPYHGAPGDLGEYTIYDYLFSGSLFKRNYTVAH